MSYLNTNTSSAEGSADYDSFLSAYFFTVKETAMFVAVIVPLWLATLVAGALVIGAIVRYKRFHSSGFLLLSALLLGEMTYMTCQAGGLCLALAERLGAYDQLHPTIATVLGAALEILFWINLSCMTIISVQRLCCIVIPHKFRAIFSVPNTLCAVFIVIVLFIVLEMAYFQRGFYFYWFNNMLFYGPLQFGGAVMEEYVMLVTVLAFVMCGFSVINYCVILARLTVRRWHKLASRGAARVGIMNRNTTSSTAQEGNESVTGATHYSNTGALPSITVSHHGALSSNDMLHSGILSGTVVSHTEVLPSNAVSHTGAIPSITVSQPGALSSNDVSHIGVLPSTAESHTEALPSTAVMHFGTLHSVESHPGALPSTTASHTEALSSTTASHTGALPSTTASHSGALPSTSVSHSGAQPISASSHPGAHTNSSSDYQRSQPYARELTLTSQFMFITVVYLIGMIIFSLPHWNDDMLNFVIVSNVILTINNCIDPFMCILLNKDLRNHVKKIIHCR